MDAKEGLEVLSRRGWLSTRPQDFRDAVLAQGRWRAYEPGAPINLGGDEEEGDLFGVASGSIEIATVFGPPGAPITHVAQAVFWLGYGPILSGQARRASVTARSAVWLARIPQAAVMALLAERPEWWRHIGVLALEYGDISANIAADLMIRDSERRCAAVLLRLAGCRFSDSPDAASFIATLTQDELAVMANLSRNSTGAVVRKLARLGLIEIGYGAITVRSPKGLRATVDSA